MMIFYVAFKDISHAKEFYLEVFGIGSFSTVDELTGGSEETNQ